MTPEQLDKIETDARKANAHFDWKPVIHSDKWRPSDTEGALPDIITCDGVYGMMDGRDAQHIANMNPTATLELIAHIRELETQLAAVRHVADTINGGSTAWDTRDRIYEALGDDK